MSTFRGEKISEFDRPQLTCSENVVSCIDMIFEICQRTTRHADIHMLIADHCDNDQTVLMKPIIDMRKNCTQRRQTSPRVPPPGDLYLKTLPNVRLVPPSDELDETRVVFDSGHSFYYMAHYVKKSSTKPKGMTCRTAVKGRPSHGRR